MSKSYRKYPLLIQDKGDDLKYHNRKVRYNKLAKLPNGGTYKKQSPRNFWSYHLSREQAIQLYKADSRLQSKFLTLEEWLNYWESCTIRK